MAMPIMVWSAHLDIELKHFAGKHLGVTGFLSRNPVSKPELLENYDEESVEVRG